jgi:cytidylate kinase
MVKKIVVAVDGPAGSGKSSVSKEVAVKAGLKYVDSGALYRSVTWYMLGRFGSVEEGKDYGSIASAEMRIEQTFNADGRSVTTVNGTDVSSLIRDERITGNIGIISDNVGVREFVNGLLRRWAGEESIIMDGRDIGTVVFPDADLKIYCDASVEVRAERRCREYAETGKKVDVKDIKNQIIQRDAQDRNRKYGALKIADDAIVLDTSAMPKDQVVSAFLDLIREKRGV